MPYTTRCMFICTALLVWLIVALTLYVLYWSILYSYLVMLWFTECAIDCMLIIVVHHGVARCIVLYVHAWCIILWCCIVVAYVVFYRLTVNGERRTRPGTVRLPFLPDSRLSLRCAGWFLVLRMLPAVVLWRASWSDGVAVCGARRFARTHSFCCCVAWWICVLHLCLLIARCCFCFAL